ncbi:hypothetical protein [Phenylobacterium sp.]|uniref:hypothetical protein n=1 Tax=Phenylobacterium sp. TaxID=1871053 RepID=UPI0035AF7B89
MITVLVLREALIAAGTTNASVEQVLRQWVETFLAGAIITPPPRSPGQPDDAAPSA